MTTQMLAKAESNQSLNSRRPCANPSQAITRPVTDASFAFVAAAGNMAIQRAALGALPSVPDDAARSMGMSGDECSCGGDCSECQEKQVQRKATGELAAVPAEFETALQRSGTGAPLPSETRRTMESRFGERLDDVRIHDNA